MNGTLQAVKLTDAVYWVGAVDWGIRDFHGYSTGRGTTYNAYLILADKITLIDTVKKSFQDELLQRIRSVIDPESIDYIISNHSEMDHSGCLPEVIARVKPEKVFASVMGARNLKAHFHWDVDVTAVKSGDALDLGNMRLQFLETRLLHWPDSMFSYLVEEKMLFSQDAFGMHLASSERFADELDGGLVREETAKYYANILMPYAPLITKLLDQVRALGLDIRWIAHDHGPIWRKDISRVLDWYADWAAGNYTAKAVLVYATMWGSTERMAKSIADGLSNAGVSVKMMPMGAAHRSDVATELLDTRALVVGSPTINSMMFPSMADVLNYIKGLKPRRRIGAVFGSYGWGGESIRQLRDALESMKIPVEEEIKVRFVPTKEQLDNCFRLGTSLAEKINGEVK